MADRVDDAPAAGRRPYPLPRGGATPVGAVGYAYAARELAEQMRRARHPPDASSWPTGSGGTQAGLVAGRVGHAACRWRVVGASVSRPLDEAADRVLRAGRGLRRRTRRPGSGARRRGRSRPPRRRLRHGLGGGPGRARDLALHVAKGCCSTTDYGAKAMTLLRRVLADERPAGGLLAHRRRGRGARRH